MESNIFLIHHYPTASQNLNLLVQRLETSPQLSEDGRCFEQQWNYWYKWQQRDAENETSHSHWYYVLQHEKQFV